MGTWDIQVTGKNCLGDSGDSGKSNHLTARKLNDFSRDKISKRINWDYGVYGLTPPKDEDGVQTITWIEKPTPLARAAAIAGALAAGATVILASFGAAAAGIVAFAIKLLEQRERTLTAIFEPQGSIINPPEAEKIKNLNKNKIQELLKEIAKLLNDNKVDSFDLDAAKEKIEIFKKLTVDIYTEEGEKLTYEQILSKNNKAEFKKLDQDHTNKQREYTEIIEKNAKEILSELSKLKQDFENNFKKLSDQMTDHHAQKMLSFNNILNRLEDVDQVILEFNNSLDDNNEKYNELILKEESIQDYIGELRDEIGAKFNSVKSQVEDLNEEIMQEMKELSNEIIASRERMEEELNNFQKQRQINFENSKLEFEKLIENYSKHAENMKANFLSAQEDRQKQYESNIEISGSLLNDMKMYTENLGKNLDSLSYEIKESASAQRDAINNLGITSKQLFLDSIDDAEEKAKKAQDEMFEINKEANIEFEKAVKARQEQYKAQEKQILELETSIFEQRREADIEFEEAARARQEQYEAQEGQILELETSILEQRREADIEFEEAAKERQENHQEQNDKLSEGLEEILELKAKVMKEFAEAKEQVERFNEENKESLNNLSEGQRKIKEDLDRGFEEAKQEVQRIDDENQLKLEELTNNVKSAKKEIDANFKKAEKNRNDTYDKTSSQLQEVKDNIELARNEINENFKKAEESRNANLSQIQKEIEELKVNIVQRDSSIKLLQSRKEKFDVIKKQIDNNSHPNIIEIKSKQKDVNGLAKFNMNNAKSEIKSLLKSINEEKDIKSKEILINKAFEISFQAANLHGNSYHPEIADPLKLKEILLLKNQIESDRDIGKILQNMNGKGKDMLSFMFDSLNDFSTSETGKKSICNKEDMSKILESLISENSELQKLVQESGIENKDLKNEIEEILESFGEINENNSNYLDNMKAKIMGEISYEE